VQGRRLRARVPRRRARRARSARRAPRPEPPPRADINCEIFDVDDGNKLSVAIATSLSLDGTDTTDFLQLDGRPSLLDQYDYVMHGVVYKFKAVGGTKVEVLLSHGGLLARFIGDQRHLQKLKVDTEVYTLIRKV
jgi:DNA-directed RNA polymerase I, II, and III subunit RPABC3